MNTVYVVYIEFCFHGLKCDRCGYTNAWQSSTSLEMGPKEFVNVFAYDLEANTISCEDPRVVAKTGGGSIFCTSCHKESDSDQLPQELVELISQKEADLFEHNSYDSYDAAMDRWQDVHLPGPAGFFCYLPRGKGK